MTKEEESELLNSIKNGIAKNFPNFLLLGISPNNGSLICALHECKRHMVQHLEIMLLEASKAIPALKIAMLCVAGKELGLSKEEMLAALKKVSEENVRDIFDLGKFKKTNQDIIREFKESRNKTSNN